VVDTPIQEEKTIGDEQEDANEEEECCKSATDVFPHLFGGPTSGNATPEQTVLSNSSPSPDQIATPKSASPVATSPSISSLNQPLTPIISTKPEDATAKNITKCWMIRDLLVVQKISSLEIMVVLVLLLLLLLVVDLEVGTSKDTIVVDAHIFQHTPAEIGMESYLRTVLHVSHRLNQLHSYRLKMQ